MDNILEFQENDNFLNSIEFKENLKLFIRTWDEKLFQVEFEDCCKLELNSEIEFELGTIIKKDSSDFNSEWEKSFVSEYKNYSEYHELIFYDAWDYKRINLRLIYTSYTIKQL